MKERAKMVKRYILNGTDAKNILQENGEECIDGLEDYKLFIRLDEETYTASVVLTNHKSNIMKKIPLVYVEAIGNMLKKNKI